MARPTEGEMEDALADATERKEEGGRVPGMTYEEGVEAALLWALGQTDEHPLAE